MNSLKRTMVGPGCLLCLLALGAGLAVGQEAGDVTAHGLTCEYAHDPLGIDVAQPRFGWILKSNTRAQLQSAYQILVASSEAKLARDVGDKWDSAKVQSDQSVNIDYQGEALTSWERCHWKVRVWDRQARPSAWSRPASFEMGLMQQSDWQGQWIGVALPDVPAALLDAHRPGRANVALHARPSTSYVSGHETLDAVNDGLKLSDSNDKRHGAYGNWPQQGVHWVTYTWPEPVHVDSIDVYWFDDKAGVRLPKASRLLCWDGRAFVPVQHPVGLGVKGDQYNMTTFEAVFTSRLKLEFDSLPTASTGILEFKVYDAGKSPTFPPVVKVNRFLAMAAAANAPAPLLRREFHVTRGVRQARVYLSGLGWSELSINGRKVSDDVLSPGLTD